MNDDFDLLNKKEQQIIQDLRNADSKERGYKKQKILELREIYLLKFEHGKLPIKEKRNLSSYIWQSVLEKEEITYTKGHFYELFSDDEKVIRTGTNMSSTDGNLEHNWSEPEVVGNLKIQECSDCDSKLINDVVYNVEKIEEPKIKIVQDFDSSQQTTELRDEERYPIPRMINRYIAMISGKSGNDVRSFTDNLEEMKSRYLSCLEESTNFDEKAQHDAIKKEFDEFFTEKKLDELNKFITEQIGEQKHLANLLDWRLRIGKYEKLIAKSLMLGDQFIHEVAKKLHCSAKHMKNDVLKEDIERDLKKFRECPKCHAPIADEINRQITYSNEAEKDESRFGKELVA